MAKKNINGSYRYAFAFTFTKPTCEYTSKGFFVKKKVILVQLN